MSQDSTGGSGPPPAADHTPAKATLFCPGCDRAAHARAGWLPCPGPAAVVLRCPECGARVARRPWDDGLPMPGPARPARPGVFTGPLRLVGHSVRWGQSLARAWFHAGRAARPARPTGEADGPD